jgi:hypothetical protein
LVPLVFKGYRVQQVFRVLEAFQDLLELLVLAADPENPERMVAQVNQL